MFSVVISLRVNGWISLNIIRTLQHPKSSDVCATKRTSMINTNIGGGVGIQTAFFYRFEHEMSRCAFRTCASHAWKSPVHVLARRTSTLVLLVFFSLLYECEDSTIKLATTVSFYLFSYCTSILILIFHLTVVKRSRDISVGKAKGYGLDYWGSDPGRGKIFLFSATSGLTLRPNQPPIKWVLWAIPPGVKRLGHQADYSPPSSIEVMNGGHTFTSPYVFMT
jgi:hypothetical protein